LEFALVKYDDLHFVACHLKVIGISLCDVLCLFVRQCMVGLPLAIDRLPDFVKQVSVSAELYKRIANLDRLLNSVLGETCIGPSDWDNNGKRPDVRPPFWETPAEQESLHEGHSLSTSISDVTPSDTFKLYQNVSKWVSFATFATGP
jgi:hypothetical protein